MRQHETCRPSEASDEGVGSREQSSQRHRRAFAPTNGDGTHAHRAAPVFAQRTADGPISRSGVLWPRMAAGVEGGSWG